MLKCKMRSFLHCLCLLLVSVYRLVGQLYGSLYLLTALLGVWAWAKRDRSACLSA